MVDQIAKGVLIGIVLIMGFECLIEWGKNRFIQELDERRVWWC